VITLPPARLESGVGRVYGTIPSIERPLQDLVINPLQELI